MLHMQAALTSPAAIATPASTPTLPPPSQRCSGHYTMDGCVTSQFENHVRAVLGWPLGETRWGRVGKTRWGGAWGA